MKSRRRWRNRVAADGVTESLTKCWGCGDDGGDGDDDVATACGVSRPVSWGRIRMIRTAVS